MTVGAGGIWVYASGAVYRVSADNLVARVAGTPFCSGDLAAGTGAVWVTNPYFATELLRVDPAALKIVGRIPLDFVPGNLTANGDDVWIVDGRHDSVVEISPRTNRVMARVKVGNGPTAVTSGEGSLWVANVDDGTISRIDPKCAEVVATIDVGPNPTHLAAGEGGVWVIVHPK